MTSDLRREIRARIDVIGLRVRRIARSLQACGAGNMTVRQRNDQYRVAMQLVAEIFRMIVEARARL